MLGRGTEKVHASASGRSLPHVPSLDGLRGVAVAAVVAFHFWPNAIPGGFVGVDVFFVLSGFLLTSLLVLETGSSGGVDIRGFFVRRVRRLTPALLLLLSAVLVFGAVTMVAEELQRVRAHSFWTLGYLANWRFVADGTTYTDVVLGSSPLRHTWSLAIEEQFYLVLAALAALLAWRARGDALQLRRRLGMVAVVGFAASATWMVVLSLRGASIDRTYFGTDTRAQAMLAGVALGCVLVGRPARRSRLAVIAALAGVVVLVVVAAIAQERALWMHRGGFTLVAVAAAAVIAGCDAALPVRWLLRQRVVVALGVISYGVYLWHWPVLVLVDESATGLRGPALTAVRLAIVLGAATASYFLVERPIRRGALGRAVGGWSIGVAPVATAAVVLLVVATTVTPRAPTSLLVSAAAPAPPSTAAWSEAAGPAPVADTKADTTDEAGVTAEPVRAVLLGDSVAHTLAGGEVGTFPDFPPWSPEQSPYDPAQVDLVSLARPACSYLEGEVAAPTAGGGVTPASLAAMCGDWRGDLAYALTAHQPDIVVIALAEVTDHFIDGELVPIDTPEYAALLASFLDEVRSDAGADGAELVLLALPGRVPPASNGDWDEDGWRERALAEHLADYAASHESVRFIDMGSVICPDGDCGAPPAGYDPAWRYDGVHFTRDGALWVAQWLTPRLQPPRDAD